MQQYISTIRIESLIVDGLYYIIRKISHNRRIELRRSTAEIDAKMREAMNRLLPLANQVDDAWEAARIAPRIEGVPEPVRPVEDDVSPPNLSKEVWVEYRKLRVEVLWNDLRVGQLFPVLIRWAVKEIGGWEIDGQPITVDLLLAEAPDDVIIEIGTKIEGVINMSLEEQLGFKSLGTSSTQVTEQAAIMSA